MNKEDNFIGFKVDILTYSKIESYCKVKGVSISDFMRLAVNNHFDDNRLLKEQADKLDDYNKLTEVIFQVNSNAFETLEKSKEYFKKLLQTIILLNPKLEDEIIAIWRKEDTSHE